MFSEALFDVFGEEEESKEERKKKRTRPEPAATREKDLTTRRKCDLDLETKKVRLDLETELDGEEEEEKPKAGNSNRCRHLRQQEKAIRTRWKKTKGEGGATPTTCKMPFSLNRQKTVAKRAPIFAVPATVVKLDTGDTCVHEVCMCGREGLLIKDDVIAYR